MTRFAALPAAALLLGACTGGTGATSTLPATSTTTAPPVLTTTEAQRRTDAAGCPVLADLRSNTPFEDVVLQGAGADGTGLWSIPLGGAFVREMVLDGGVVYAGLKAGPLVAIDAATCAEVWRAPPPVAAIGLDFHDGMLLGADAFNVAGYDAGDGTQVWRQFPPIGLDNLLDPEALAVAGDALLVVIGGSPVTIVGYGAADGGFRFAVEMGPGAPQVTGLAVEDQAFYVAAGAAVAAHRVVDGAPLWSVEPGFVPDAAPLATGGRVFVAGSGEIAAYDAATGAEVWRRAVGGSPFTSSPMLHHDELHLLDRTGRLHHLRTGDGSVVHTGSFPSCCTVAEPKAGLILVQQGGVVEGFDLLERRRWSLRTGANNEERFTRVVSDGEVVVATTWSPRGAQ